MFPYSFFEPYRKKNDSWTLHNRLSSKDYDLSPEAALIVSLCDGQHDLVQLAEQAITRFKCTPEAAQSLIYYVLDFLTQEKMLFRRNTKLEVLEFPPPEYVILEITNKCNLACCYCSVDANYRDGEDLSTSEIMALIKDLADFGVKAVGLSGGEPLLRHDCFEIASFAVERGMTVGLTSNGLLINQEIAGIIRSLGLDVQISLNGSCPEVHDALSGMDDSFQRVINGLNMLKEEGVAFTVAALATSQNLWDLPNILALAEKLGARDFRVQPFMPAGRGRSVREHLTLSPSQTKEITAFLAVAKKESKIGVGGFYFSFALDNSEQARVKRDPDNGACEAGIDLAGIMSNGNVYPCSHLWELSTDNLREHGFSWIWRNSRLFNFFRSLKSADINRTCVSCRNFCNCVGGCKATNFLEGNFSGPDPHCWVVQEEFSQTVQETPVAPKTFVTI